MISEVKISWSYRSAYKATSTTVPNNFAIFIPKCQVSKGRTVSSMHQALERILLNTFKSLVNNKHVLSVNTLTFVIDKVSKL